MFTINLSKIAKTAVGHAATTIGLAALGTLGAAMLNFGPTTDVMAWARNLGLVEMGVIGSQLVSLARGYLPTAKAAIVN